mgnify:CR=1 FL=1
MGSGHLPFGLMSVVDGLEERRRPRRFEDAALRYFPAPLDPAESISITVSRLKLPLFWLGGYSLKDWMNWPAMACAGTRVQSLSLAQRRYMSDS